MATPTPTVEIAFGANWDDTAPTWVDVTDAVESWSADRKYGWESGVYQGGRCSFSLIDHDRTYDPLHATGAYYGDLEASGMPVQISETHGGSPDNLFYGYVDKVTRAYGPHGRGVTTFECVDLWAMLAAAYVTGDYAEDTTGNRAGAMLNATIPAAFYAVTTPTPGVTMPAKTYDAVTLADALAGIVAAEAGMVWVDRFGLLQFAGRHYAASSRMLNDQATLSDVAADSSVIRYNPIAVEWDSGDIVNAAVASRVGGTVVTTEDATSVARYGRREKSLTGLEVVDDIQAAVNAKRLVAQRKDPLLRIPPAVFDVLAETGSAHEHACERDLWDRVRWKMTPYGGGAVEDRDAFITGIGHSWTANPGGTPYWRVTWDLVDAALFDRLDPENWWQWGGTYSQWGGTYSQWAP